MANEDIESKVDIILNVIPKNLEAVDEVAESLEKAEKQVQESQKKTEGVMSDNAESAEEMANAGNEAANSFMQMTGQGLALLFAGRFLSQVFGGMASSMFDLLGVSDMFSSVMTATLLPAFLAVQPVLIQLMEVFMELDEDTKMLIGSLVMIAAVLAPIIMIGGQLLAMLAQWSISMATITAVTQLALAAFAAFAAGVVAGMVIVERFGPVVAAIIAVVAGLVIVFVASPVVIAAAVGVLVGIMWGMRDDIIAAFKAVIRWVMDLPSALRGAASGMVSAARSIGRSVAEGIRDGIQAGKRLVIDAIAGLFPGISGDQLGGLLGAVSGGVGGAVSSFGVNDFVLSGDKLLKTHPNDVIMGTKNPESLGKGSGGDTYNISIDQPSVRDDRDIRDLAKEVEKEINRGAKGRGRTR